MLPNAGGTQKSLEPDLRFRESGYRSFNPLPSLSRVRHLTVTSSQFGELNRPHLELRPLRVVAELPMSATRKLVKIYE